MMTRRSRARECVVQLLYQHDVNPDDDAQGDTFLMRRLKSDTELILFAKSLIAGVIERIDELDALLDEISEHWTLKRMGVTDRNVLRLGAYEILHTDTPDRSAINEAVQLAKRFGSEQSPQFVNGLLDRLMHQQYDE